MNFIETKLEGAYIIETMPIRDDRGFFARCFCQDEFSRIGLNPCVAQCNISFNSKRGTLRGMHFQDAPYGEAKTIRCTSGSIYDVIIDLRPYSSTFLEWISVVLSAKNRNLLYIPEGFAHGFLTLENDTEIFYQMSEFYKPEYSKGYRWDDPAFGIEWPQTENLIISPRDLSHPLFYNLT